jgi:hypothetical protein
MIGTGAVEAVAEMGECGYEGEDWTDSLTRWIWWWNRLMRENDDLEDML